MEMLNTELDAINLCLSGIGREPVSSIETADLDAAMARAVLNQVSLDIQTNGGRGWWFNREDGWKLQTNETTGRIDLPNNTLSILESRGRFFDVGNRLTVRGSEVYDTDNHTFDMRDNVGKDGKIEFMLLLLLDYSQLPTAARSAVSWRARRIFSDDVLGDTRQHEINMRNEQRAFGLLEVENRRTLRTNYLKDNRLINARLGRIGGYNNMYR